MNGRLAHCLIKFHHSLASISPSKNVQHTSGFYWLVRADRSDCRLCLVRCAVNRFPRQECLLFYLYYFVIFNWNLWLMIKATNVLGPACFSQHFSWSENKYSPMRCKAKSFNLFPTFNLCQYRWWALSKTSHLRYFPFHPAKIQVYNLCLFEGFSKRSFWHFFFCLLHENKTKLFGTHL